MSANSRLVDGRLQKLRGGGTRFSEKVKSYLTARFDVDTQTGREPDLSEVATDMRTTSLSLRSSIRNASSSCKSTESRSHSSQISTFSALVSPFFPADCRQSGKNDWTCLFVSHSSLERSWTTCVSDRTYFQQDGRNTSHQERWPWYLRSSRPTKKYSQNSMWKHLPIFWTVVQILRYKDNWVGRVA